VTRDDIAAPLLKELTKEPNPQVRHPRGLDATGETPSPLVL
jgi:hypothetical protein